MTASALLASRWPALYASGQLTVVETPIDTTAEAVLEKRRECSRIKQQELREARKIAGVCMKCGAERQEGRMLCPRHMKEGLEYMRKRREKIK